MPKAYVIAHIDVTDPEAYARYTAKTPETIAAFGGSFLVRAGRTDAREGPARSRNVLIEFPDFATARAFYDSPAYQAILPHALAGSVRELMIVEGVPEA